jgi:hypothetical protein
MFFHFILSDGKQLDITAEKCELSPANRWQCFNDKGEVTATLQDSNVVAWWKYADAQAPNADVKVTAP